MILLSKKTLTLDYSIHSYRVLYSRCNVLYDTVLKIVAAFHPPYRRHSLTAQGDFA